MTLRECLQRRLVREGVTEEFAKMAILNYEWEVMGDMPPICKDWLEWEFCVEKALLLTVAYAKIVQEIKLWNQKI